MNRIYNNLYQIFYLSTIFSALHGMPLPARTSDDKGVRLFVYQTRAL